MTTMHGTETRRQRHSVSIALDVDDLSDALERPTRELARHDGGSRSFPASTPGEPATLWLFAEGSDSLRRLAVVIAQLADEWVD